MHYVYILQNRKKAIYIGCTQDLQSRIARHNKGHVPATAKLRPLKLIFYAAFPNKYIAYQFEKYLKSGNGRTFINKRLIPNKKDAYL
jgi:predicted GIY-YIG superfamily endonuclease